MVTTDNFEKLFSKYFQRQITIKVGDEELRTGKFLLIQNNVVNNNFYFELLIESVKKISVFKIPYPFAVDEYENEMLIYLDYRLNTFTKNKELTNEMKRIANRLKTEKLSKFFDNIVEIEFK